MKKLRISFLSLFILLHSVSAIAGEIGEVEIHGFISQGYLKTDRNNYMADTEDGTFQFNEMGINFQTRVSEKLKIGTQFIARDLGTIGNDEIKIDWAFADYRYSNIIGVRAGSLKIPIGFYNEARDVDSVRTNIILPPSIYAEEWRDVFVGLKGVGIYGRLPGRVSYVLQNGTLDLPLDSGYMRIVKNNTEALLKKELTVPIEVEMTGNMVKKFLNGNIEWVTPITGLRFNASINSIALDVNMNLGMFGNQTLRIDKFYATYWSLQYVIGETVLTGEYTYQDIDGELMGNDVENNLEGFHLNITHRFTNWFEIGGYYSEYYYDSDDRDGNLYAPNNHMAWEKNYCLSTRFDINDYWLLKLETHYIDGTLFVTPDDKEKPDDLEPEFFLFAAKISYAF